MKKQNIGIKGEKKMPDIRSLYEKDYIGQWDVADGDLTLTIKDVIQDNVLDPTTFENKKKVCLVFKETNKKMVLNATNRDIIAKDKPITVKREGKYETLGYGYDYAQWIGKKIALYKDTRVNNPADPSNKGGIRIRGSVSSADMILCDNCKNPIEARNGMTTSEVAAFTESRYGKKLCTECSKKAAEEMKK